MSAISSTSGSSGSPFSFDGLSSGLNTTAIVDQLMQIEALPQTLTKNRMAGFQREDAALSSVISKLTNSKVSADKLASQLNWQPVAAVSSDTDTVGVSATSASGLASTSFTVDALAKSDSFVSNWSVGATSAQVVAAPGGGGARTITVGVGSDSRSIDVGDGTLDSVVAAINGQSNFKLTASAVAVGPNSFRLQLSSADTGSANTVSFQAGDFATATAGSWLHVSTAADAQITMGSGASSLTVTATTNTLTDVLPGVTMTLKRTTAPGTTVTVGSSRNSSALADSIASMVNDLNSAIVEMNNQTKYDATKKIAGPLLDNPSVRQLKQLLSEAVSGSSGSTNAGLAGISLDRDGTVLFDRGKFLDTYAKDPIGTQALFTDGASPGFGKRISNALDRALAPDTGLLKSSQKGVEDTVSQLQATIDSMQIRLDSRRAAIKAQFDAMEKALSSMKTQTSALTSQLSSLSTG